MGRGRDGKETVGAMLGDTYVCRSYCGWNGRGERGGEVKGSGGWGRKEGEAKAQWENLAE